MEKQVLRANPLDISNWNELVLEHPGYSFFHTKEWAKVLSVTYDYKPIYFCILKDNRLVSAIPTMLVKSIFTGKRLVSLPYTDRCEPLINSSEDTDELKNDILKYCKENKINRIEFRASARLFQYEPPAHTDLYYLLDLHRSEDEIFRSFSENTRRNIKKAIKNSVQVFKQNNEEGLRLFYSMLCKTRKRHGIPPQPFSFYKNFYRQIILKNAGDIRLAQSENKIIAGAIFMHIGKRAIFKYGASDTVFKNSGANHFIMWEAIKEYNRLGYEELDLGRTEKGNEGLKRYKLGFDTKEGLIHRDILDVKSKKPILTKIKASDFNKAFSKLPVTVLRLIGKLTYKHFG